MPDKLSPVDLEALEARAWSADGLDYETSTALIQRLREAEADAKAFIDLSAQQNGVIAQLRAVRDAARDFFVDVDGEAMCDAWDGHCGCSAFRLSAALAALEEPRLIENATEPKGNQA